jgi:serine O-acetyltransferase
MFSLLKAYRRYDPAAKSSLEVLLLYPGVRVMFFYRIGHFFYSLRGFFLARLFCELGRWLSGIEIHPGAVIGKNFIIDHGMGTVIGETAHIGNDVVVYQGVTLGGTDLRPIKRHPTIEDRVIIGAGAKVLGPITIGADSRIGANAVVISNVEKSMTAVGIPAKSMNNDSLSGHTHKANPF